MAGIVDIDLGKSEPQCANIAHSSSKAAVGDTESQLKQANRKNISMAGKA